MKKLYFALLMLVALVATSCHGPQRILYLQDLNDSTSFKIAQEKSLVIHPEDRLYIMVSSRDEQTSKLFQQQTSGMMSGGMSQERGGYIVDKEGYIDFPILGKLQVAGKTRSQVSDYVKQEIESRNMLKDPTVMVELGNACVYVLGEMGSGTISIEKDHLSILEAISKAGDLNINGLRKNIRVIREEDGVLKNYTVDLTSADNITSSPVYYLQQNDIIYVEPNSIAIYQSTRMGNTVRTPAFWISMASVAATVLVWITAIK